MKRYIAANSKTERLSAMDLGDEFYDNFDGLVEYLKSLPVGTQIFDIVHAPGAHWAGEEVPVEKESGYETVYYNRFGIAPSDAKFENTWWRISASKTHEYDLAKIILQGTKYYCTADVFMDDDADL